MFCFLLINKISRNYLYFFQNIISYFHFCTIFIQKPLFQELFNHLFFPLALSRRIDMFGFQGGESAETVARKKGYMKGRSIEMGFSDQFRSLHHQDRRPTSRHDQDSASRFPRNRRIETSNPGCKASGSKFEAFGPGRLDAATARQRPSNAAAAAVEYEPEGQTTPPLDPGRELTGRRDGRRRWAAQANMSTTLARCDGVLPCGDAAEGAAVRGGSSPSWSFSGPRSAPSDVRDGCIA